MYKQLLLLLLLFSFSTVWSQEELTAYQQKKVVLIVDALVGPTDNDLQMLHSLNELNKSVVVVANKIDKLKKNEVQKKLK